MNKRRVETEQTIHTFKVSGDPHNFILGARPKLKEDGEIYKIHIPDSKSDFHGGFKKIMLEIEADENNMIVQFQAVIDIYYVPPSYLVKKEQIPVRLGQVNYAGNLVPGTTKPKWNTKIIVSSAFTQKKSAKLPPKVREIGPGAIITAVTQSLFGTLDGIKMLDLESYKIPDADVGLTDIKILSGTESRKPTN